jgi:predicted nucleotidyltransferase
MGVSPNGDNEIMVQKTSEKRVPPVAEEYAREVRRRLNDRVSRIVLFGSHARGEGTLASDYDFLIVADPVDREAREAVVDAGVAVLNSRDALCAPLLYTEEQWEKVRRSPLGWNVEREGVAL